MSEPRGSANRYIRLLLVLVIFAAVVSVIVRHINSVGNVLLVIVGFGSVVLVHEFGHFIVAKLTDIKVEAFSIGFPPTFLGVRRTESGYRIRILPDLLPSEDEQGDGMLSFTIGWAAKAWETEYRIGLIPFGGFVKMLGQSDVKENEKDDDPRSYANKPVGVRTAVIAAGVTFNIICAFIIFIIAFLVGIKQPPPIIGGVLPDSPAAKAGLKAGDEVIKVADKSKDLNFRDILTAAALSGRDEKVELKVKHADGTVEDYALVPEQMNTAMGNMRFFGLLPAQTLTVAQLSASDVNELFARTGLKPGDRIKTVNGKDITAHWELTETIKGSFLSTVSMLTERIGESGETKLIETKIKLGLVAADGKPEQETSHVFSMVPRLRLANVSTGADGRNGTIDLKSDDIILAIGDVENPTYKEMREVTTRYEDKQMPIKVLRTDSEGRAKELTITVTPKYSKNRQKVIMGILLIPAFDTEHAVVAKTIEIEGGPKKPAIPRGALITAVGGAKVSSFFDIIRELRRNAGQQVAIDYELNEDVVGSVTVDAGDVENSITVKTVFSEFVPFEPLERLYKAGGPIEAVDMGCRRATRFITEAFVTLKRLLGGLISPKNFMGPVGIMKISYQIVAQRPFIYLVYFLGLLSTFLGVLNSFPMLPFDGGHIVFLLAEKIKGSPVSERVQTSVTYVGLAIVGAFFLYVTFNDIVRTW